jgi:hypothetical protein
MSKREAELSVAGFIGRGSVSRFYASVFIVELTFLAGPYPRPRLFAPYDLYRASSIL